MEPDLVIAMLWGVLRGILKVHFPRQVLNFDSAFDVRQA